MLNKWIKAGIVTAILLLQLTLAFAEVAPNTTVILSVKDKNIIMGEKLGFMSSNPVTFQQLISKKSSMPQPVWGYLNLPKTVNKQRVPVVVMMPGAGGLSDWYSKYVAQLNTAGIATFQIDSFSPRGLGGIANDQAQLPVPMLVADAYAALQYLSKEPNIDAKKIAIMGWSLGGLVSITTAFADLNEKVLKPGQHFAAHIAFYPACNLIYPNARLDGAPWLYLHGGGDDYTQPTDCLDLIAKLRNSTRITAQFYPAAPHAFDNPRPQTWLPDVQNPKNCHGVLANDWSLTEKTTGAPINAPADYQKAYSACMLRGAHLGYEKAASADAMWQVNNFLQHNLTQNKLE